MKTRPETQKRKFQLGAVVCFAFLFLMFSTQSVPAQIQWANSVSNPNDIYNTNTGNVGVGTNTPASRLHVNGGELRLDHTVPLLSFYIAGARKAFFQFDPAGAGSFNFNSESSTAVMRFFTNNTERLRVDANGNVGIGTTSPLSKLDIAESSTSATRGMISTQYSNDTLGSRLILRKARDTSGTSSAAIQSGDSMGLILFNAFDGSVFADATRISANPTQTWTTSAHGSNLSFSVTPNNSTTITAAMNIDQNGNVGIGAPAPNYKLHVQGSSSRNTLALVGDGDAAGYAGIKLEALTTTGIAADRSSAFNLHMRKDNWYGGDGSGPSFIIETVSKVGGFAAPFLITPTNHVILNGGAGASGLSYGNVGIGTTSPSYKLDVAGQIRSSSGGFIFPDGTVQTTAASGGGGAVASVFGRTGAVVAATNDYTWAQINKTTSSLADLTTRSASDLSSGTVAPARLGSGTANATTFLRGDNTWAALPGSQWTTNGTSIGYTSGNVGIGTNSPATRLHVNGTTLTGISSGTAGDYNARSLLLTTRSLNDGVASLGFDANSTYRGAFDFTGSSGDLRWYTNGGANWNNTFTVAANGNVGIGTAAPSYRLDVESNAQWAARFKKTDATHGGIIVESAASYNPNIVLSVNGTIKWYMNNNVANGDSLQFWESTGSNPRLTLTQGGNVGIGTATPLQRFQVGSSTAAGSTAPDAISLGASYSTVARANPKLRLFDNNAGSLYGLGVSDSQLDFMVPAAARYVWSVSGAEKMRLDESGNLTVTGNIAAKYQDVAEWVPSSQQLAAATVVVLDSTKSNQVIASTQAYDTRVAGVVSETPGIALGESGADRVLVATTGRVRVKVDATRAPIRIGDLLVTSDVSGVAMKSEPVSVGGIQLHRPGTIIGKALEPLAKGQATILVLLSLQ